MVGAQILLPKGAKISAIGGRSPEFTVTDKNDDEYGNLHEALGKLGPIGGNRGLGGSR